MLDVELDIEKTIVTIGAGNVAKAEIEMAGSLDTKKRVKAVALPTFPIGLNASQHRKNPVQWAPVKYH